MARIICSVYKGSLKQDTYLYIDKKEGLKRVPPALLSMFGKLSLSLTFLLTPDRKLAREDAAQVYANILANGFHLQLPPVEEFMASAPSVAPPG